MEPAKIIEGIRSHLDVPYHVDFLGIDTGLNIIDKLSSIVLGIIVYTVVIFMTLITVLDIAYLNIPAIRDTVEKIRWDGSRGLELRAVSRDALSALEESNTVELTKSPVAIYILKRTVSYIKAVAIIIVVMGGSRYIAMFVGKIVAPIAELFNS